MRRILLFVIAFILACRALNARAVDPIPETQQAALAQKILDAAHGPLPATPPKLLHIVYFTPANRDPEPRYRERLSAILEDIRAFYRDGMQRTGFGPETFDLPRDQNGQPVITLVKGHEPERAYQKPDSEKIIRECRPILDAAGISFEHETILIFCNLANWDPQTKTFSHHSPYYGMLNQTHGLCFAADSSIIDLDNIPKNEPVLHDDEYGKMSLGKFNVVFIGGIAHELGHALDLPHCGERWDEKPLGTSLMGVGNHTYREERRGDGRGSFLAMSSAMILAGRPLFSKTDKDFNLAPTLETNSWQISTNVTRPDLIGRPAAMRLEGIVKGTPPIYSVIAYFDSVRDGGYHAPTVTSVPDAEGRYAIEISDLAPCAKGELRIQFCHANGATSETNVPFRITRDHTLDLTQQGTLKYLEPLVHAVVSHDLPHAESELAQIQNDAAASPLTKNVAQHLVATLQDKPKPTPADVPAATAEIPLGDTQYQSAKVGWLVPSANRIPLSDEVESSILDSGEIHATGFFAHSPSSYVFNLDGKWKHLHGSAALHTAFQPYGSVIFIIKTDGREAFHSPAVRGTAEPTYDVDLTGVKTLELITDKAHDRNGGNWALWLDPILSRN